MRFHVGYARTRVSNAGICAATIAIYVAPVGKDYTTCIATKESSGDMAIAISRAGYTSTMTARIADDIGKARTF